MTTRRHLTRNKFLHVMTGHRQRRNPNVYLFKSNVRRRSLDDYLFKSNVILTTLVGSSTRVIRYAVKI